MTHSPYNPPSGGHPGQTALMTGRAVFTDAYAVIPHGVMRDIVTSALPFWDGTRAWIIARPLSGFAETFAQYLMEVAPGGGSDRPEPDPQAEGVVFVVEGQGTLTADGGTHPLRAGSYAYLAPGTAWTLRNDGGAALRFWKKMPGERLAPADGEATLCGLFVETDDATGLARRVEPVRLGGRLSPAMPAV